MRLVVFGLTMSSSWGNGHATLWRALCRALAREGHHVTFFERDVPYYAAARDLVSLPGCDLRIYREWSDAEALGREALANADVGLVTSYCPDGRAAVRLLLELGAAGPEVRAFYDLDTPVTLERLARGEEVAYLPENGLGDLDLVLSYTGGAALDALRERLGARRVEPLYGSVDPEVHAPAPGIERFRSDLSYLGTYADDRQAALERLFLAPAAALPEKRFLLAGSMYPQSFPWRENVFYVSHVPPPEHPALFGSSRLTLNVTRASMAALGYCPSGRLFEAAACGVPLASDRWEGLETFFTPGEEIALVDTAADMVALLRLPPDALRPQAARARQRALDEHSCTQRARELVAVVERTASARRPPEAKRDEAREAMEVGP